MRSLRRTALLWMTAVITGVGLAGAGLAYVVALHEANSFMDAELRQLARNAAQSARAPTQPSLRLAKEDDIVVQVWGADGRLTNVGEGTADIPRQDQEGFSTMTVGDTAWRVFATGGSTQAIQVSQQVEVRHELAETAALQVAVPLLVLLPLGWLIVGWAMGRALSDLDRLARHVEGLPADSRDPIDLARVPVEAAPLVTAMNRLIERLRASLTQQRRFLSDAAHELRTPLTALTLQIANLERSRAAGSPTEASPGAMADLKQGTRRATALVEQLLRIARYDAAADRDDRLNLDLRAVLLDAVADHVPLAESRSIDLGVVASDIAPFWGNERDLRVLFGNLIDNAIKYTPAGGTVDVGIVRRGGLTEVTVCDTGPGIDADLLPRVFDRFFRAASSDIEGSGLGLAVAEAVAQRHGLVIKLANRRDRAGLRATVTPRNREAILRRQSHHASAAPPTSSQS